MDKPIDQSDLIEAITHLGVRCSSVKPAYWEDFFSLFLFPGKGTPPPPPSLTGLSLIPPEITPADERSAGNSSSKTAVTPPTPHQAVVEGQAKALSLSVDVVPQIKASAPLEKSVAAQPKEALATLPVSPSTVSTPSENLNAASQSSNFMPPTPAPIAGVSQGPQPPSAKQKKFTRGVKKLQKRPVATSPKSQRVWHDKSLPEKLSISERNELAGCETVITGGFRTFVEVGRALAKVRDHELYREEFNSFQEYCEKKWEYRRQHVYRLIDGAEVMTHLSSPIGDVPQLPVNEAQVRPLVGLRPEQIQQAWTTAVTAAKGKPVTAKLVAEAAAKFRPSKNKKAKMSTGKIVGVHTHSKLENLLSESLKQLDLTLKFLPHGAQGEKIKKSVHIVRQKIEAAVHLMSFHTTQGEPRRGKKQQGGAAKDSLKTTPHSTPQTHKT